MSHNTRVCPPKTDGTCARCEPFDADPRCADLDRFPRDGFEVGTEISDPHAILLRSRVLTTADHVTPNLRAVALRAVRREQRTGRRLHRTTASSSSATRARRERASSVLWKRNSRACGVAVVGARRATGGLDYVASVKDVARSGRAERAPRGGGERSGTRAKKSTARRSVSSAWAPSARSLPKRDLRLGMKVLG